jgi:hypothetical protein
LTAPSADDAHEEVFNIAETGVKPINLQAASDIIRSMAAHYYLVATDERLTPDGRDTALESFINAIVEIRRAHNDTSFEVGDNPSCFPGCFTRLHEVTKRNPHITNIKPGLVTALNEVYINELEKVLTSQFSVCDAEQALRLCDALTILRGPGKDIAEDSAWDVIREADDPDYAKTMCVSRMNEEGDDWRYNADLLELRKKFIVAANFIQVTTDNGVIILRNMIEQIRAKLMNKYQMDLGDRDDVLVQALLADIGGNEAGPYITSAYQKRVEALNKVVPVQVGLVRPSSPSPVARTEPGITPSPANNNNNNRNI